MKESSTPRNEIVNLQINASSGSDKRCCGLVDYGEHTPPFSNEVAKSVTTAHHGFTKAPYQPHLNLNKPNLREHIEEIQCDVYSRPTHLKTSAYKLS